MGEGEELAEESTGGGGNECGLGRMWMWEGLAEEHGAHWREGGAG